MANKNTYSFYIYIYGIREDTGLETGESDKAAKQDGPNIFCNIQYKYEQQCSYD